MGLYYFFFFFKQGNVGGNDVSFAGWNITGECAFLVFFVFLYLKSWGYKIKMAELPNWNSLILWDPSWRKPTLVNSLISENESEVKVTQLCLTLWDPIGCIVHRILQARILVWVAYPFSSGSSWNRAGVSCIAGGCFTNWAIREANLIRETCIELCLSGRDFVTIYWCFGVFVTIASVTYPNTHFLLIYVGIHRFVGSIFSYISCLFS